MLSDKITAVRKNVMKEKLEEIANELLKNNKKYVIWGCGNTGYNTIEYLKSYSNGKLTPEYMIDNNKSYWNENVKSPLFFENDMNNIDIVLVCVYVADQVMEQIKNMNYQGIMIPVVSSIFNIDNEVINFYQTNMDEIEKMYEILADDRSRKTVETFLNVIYSGDISLWDNINGNSSYKLIDPEILSYGGRDSYVDVGAFTGDTLQKYLEVSKKNYESIICIEPDKNNFLALEEYVKKNKLDKTLVLNMAAGKENGVLSFSGNRSESSTLSENGDTNIRVLALDAISETQNLSILKVSTNGYDLDVLYGGGVIIQRNKPQIATYASGEQLWKIPKFLKEIVPDYKIYYRHYGIGRQAMICYAKV